MIPSAIHTNRLAAAIATALIASGSHAATLTVDTESDSPDSTACTLRNALKAVSDGSILAVPGCSADVNGDPFGTNDTILFVPVISMITLAQGELAVAAPAVTISASGQMIVAGDGSRILSVGAGATLTVNNLVLTNGKTAENGGGVSVAAGANAIFTGCSFYGNTAAAYGGAIYAAPSSMVAIVDSNFTFNYALSGGALFASNSNVTVTNSSLVYNTAYSRGGGIYANSTTLTLDTATIQRNSAVSYSGGVAVIGGNLAMIKSIVSGNNGGTAGGLYLLAADANIGTSTITGNFPVCGNFCAGAISILSTKLSVTDSTLSGNLAAGRANYVAGAAIVFGSAATFVNTTVSGNVGAGTAEASGAFWNDSGGGTRGLTLINCTVSNNTGAAVAGAAAGGILLGTTNFSPSLGDYSSLILRNSIVSANAPAHTDITLSPTVLTLEASYSVLGSAQNISAFNSPGDHNIFSDSPRLGPLQDNGGLTKSQALLPDSPALRTGSPLVAVFAAAPLNFDQRGFGFLRTFGNTVDIGAFEDQGDRLFASGLDPTP